ncbi:tetratricopeptide repeat protein [Bacteroides sp. UBA939]|uniref:tetratricopeptide repeat protein n=1 Tax=Bacteroides sp. UBA939 TaxID=1946092 RepID=UPI0025BA4617|nr:tetratricopeptide repeat protein [Bacteroides sp. UBA939]
MEQLKIIKELINQGNITEAIRLLDEYPMTDSANPDEVYYLRGNAYRKQGNWQQALNNYRYAIDLNPDSPAREAHRMAMDILNFFNKDMYNQ